MIKHQSNPQGKGLVPCLADWEAFQPSTIKNKNIEQLCAQYLTSLLVLFSDFSFRPVVGNVYYLYFKKQQWMLSLIEPGRWSPEKRGDYFGSCQLHEDMTWSFNTYDPDQQQPDTQKALREFYLNVIQTLNSDKPMSENLPFYVDDLPYYRRMAATGLARSMSHSLDAYGLLHQPSKTLLCSINSVNNNNLLCSSSA